MNKLDIIFEDNHLFVLNKPAGLLTQPSGTDNDSLEAMAKAFIKERDDKPGNVYMEAAHRLDAVASGIVVFAKTSKASKRLQESIRERKARKIYWAWVEGIAKESEAALEDYLVHEDFRSRIASSQDKKAKQARLHYKVIEQKKGKSLLEVNLETGRYHQIRIQLSNNGNPIIGDIKYGARAWSQRGIALQHKTFSIPHPTTKEIISFKVKTYM